VAPKDGDTGVFRDQAICVFSPVQLDPGSLERSISVTWGESSVPGAFEICGDGRLIFWRPLRPLEGDAPHTLVVCGLRDLRGSRLPDLRAAFTTGRALLRDLVSD
jgi:hypothetical protein